MHRFAITYHRNRRGKKFIASVLDSVEGIGKKRKEQLMIHFGGVGGIKKASVEEIASLPGMNKKVAEAVLDALHG